MLDLPFPPLLVEVLQQVLPVCPHPTMQQQVTRVSFVCSSHYLRKVDAFVAPLQSTL